MHYLDSTVLLIYVIPTERPRKGSLIWWVHAIYMCLIIKLNPTNRENYYDRENMSFCNTLNTLLTPLEILPCLSPVEAEQARWHMPLIPALRRQRQSDLLWVQGQLGLLSKFQAIQLHSENIKKKIQLISKCFSIKRGIHSHNIGY